MNCTIKRNMNILLATMIASTSSVGFIVGTGSTAQAREVDRARTIARQGDERPPTPNEAAREATREAAREAARREAERREAREAARREAAREAARRETARRESERRERPTPPRPVARRSS